MENNKFDKKDIVKEIIFMLFKIVCFFAWWCFTLAILSLLLMNVWRVEWQHLLQIAIVLTIATTAWDIISKIRGK